VSDLEGLKTRVDQAVDQLSSVQNARQDQNQNLATLLGNLEEKFSARTVELEYCNSRIDALTQDNAHLSELLERLIGLIESEPGNADDDPLIRASTMAATLLEGWSGGETPVETTSDISEPQDVSEPQDIPETQELVSEDSVSLSFEDVSDEELEAENLEVLDSDVSDLVASAVAAAREPDGEAGDVTESADDELSFDQVAVIDEEVPEEEVQDELVQPEVAEIVEEIAEEVVEDDIMDEPVAADIDIPEAEEASDEIFEEEIEEDTEASIRSMMARLEAAALDAKFAASEAEEASALEDTASDDTEQVA
jgi:hypothetical protein